jgi:HAD superfamily hydrolase (TIGR01509 family)
VTGLGNAKNQAFTTILRTDGVAPYPGTVAVLDALDDAGKSVAVVSSSANAREVLEAAGLLHRFPVIVDGIVAAQQGLAGKPEPDTFVYAARELGAFPMTSAGVEDAIAGVASGHAGGFSLVVGVDRGTGGDALRDAGADVVVTELTELLHLRPPRKVLADPEAL